MPDIWRSGESGEICTVLALWASRPIRPASACMRAG